MNACPQEIARSPSVKDNIGTQYSGLRTAAKTTRASAVLVTSQIVSNHVVSVVSKSTQSQIQNCVNLTCPHLKEKTEDGFYMVLWLTFSPICWEAIHCFCPKPLRSQKKNTSPCQQCHYASEPRILSSFLGSFLTFQAL